MQFAGPSQTQTVDQSSPGAGYLDSVAQAPAFTADQS